MSNNDGGEKKKKAGGGWGIGMKNSLGSAYAHAKTGSKNTTQTVKIQLTNQKLLDQKQKFGVDYMDLLLQGAPPEQLEACKEEALQEILRLQGKLDKYQGIISNNKQKLESKLCKMTGKPAPHTNPTMEVTDRVDTGGDGDNNGDIASKSAAAAFPDVDLGAPSNTSSNPFEIDEVEDTEVNSKVKATTEISAIPLAEAIPVSDSNNPFGVDDDDEAPSAAAVARPPASVTKSVNPFEDDNVKVNKTQTPANKSASVNPFQDDDDERGEKETAKQSSASVNPFKDDNNAEVEKKQASPSVVEKTASVNPFQDDDDDESNEKDANKKPAASGNPFEDDEASC